MAHTAGRHIAFVAAIDDPQDKVGRAHQPQLIASLGSGPCARRGLLSFSSVLHQPWQIRRGAKSTVIRSAQRPARKVAPDVSGRVWRSAPDYPTAEAGRRLARVCLSATAGSCQQLGALHVEEEVRARDGQKRSNYGGDGISRSPDVIDPPLACRVPEDTRLKAGTRRSDG